MKIKYSPISWNPYANIDALPDSEIVFVNQNSLSVDGELYEFDPLDVTWPDIREQTDGVILEAHRDAYGTLYITVRRFYTDSCLAWDTGDYHEING